jgi:hypothetical protein
MHCLPDEASSLTGYRAQYEALTADELSFDDGDPESTFGELPHSGHPAAPPPMTMT